MADAFCNLKGKVAIITGASSGIGEETAVVFAKLGAKLAITGRSAEDLERAAKRCSEENGKVKPLIIVADLTKEDDVRRVIDTTVKTYGNLDVLVNNAGIFETGTIDATDLDQLDRIFKINVRAVYQLTVLATPHLIETKGNIVNVSSAVGTISIPHALAYCMSKSALDQFTKCLSLGLADKGVRVNAVSPGYVRTNIFERGGLEEDTIEKVLERAAEVHPIHRLGKSEEVGRAIAFLASDAASFTTGQLLHVSGGYQNHYVI